MPKAINAVSVRVLVFYVAALLAMMCVIPWNLIEKSSSPFVQMFGLIGFTAAAGILNFVVLASSACSANSGIYPMPGARVMSWVLVAFFVFVIVLLAGADDTLQALLAIPMWFIVLGIVWAIVRRRSHRDDLEDGLTTS